MTDELECTYTYCERTATRVMAMPPLPQVQCYPVSPYCDEHAEQIRQMGGLPAAGPALSEQARKIEGIR